MNWKSSFEGHLIKNNFELLDKDHIVWIQKDIKDSLSLAFHEKMPKGAALREFQNIDLHLSYWESKYYKNAISKFLHNINDRDKRIVVDVGCGDGRFTEYLLLNGFTNVVATDIDLKPLISLSNFAKANNFENNLLIIRCNANNIPIMDNIVDIILAIGVFYYLNDEFEKAILESNRLLKANGLLINSEPDLEGAVYKSIFFEEINDVIENLNDKKFKEEKGETDFKFRLFEKKEIKNILSQSGFNVIDNHGLSLLPSILRIKMVRNEFNQDEIKVKEYELRKLFDYFDEFGTLYKHIIWKSEKNEKI